MCIAGFAGTPGYLSPEVLEKDPYYHPVDIWGCGEYHMIPIHTQTLGTSIYHCVRVCVCVCVCVCALLHECALGLGNSTIV